MSGAWRKLGRLFVPPAEGRHPKLLTHAANPLALHLGDHRYRVFYSGRDAENRSSVGAVDLDLVRQEILIDHPTPFFCHGPEGSFYANGVSIGGCYEVGDRRYILFMGWNTSQDGHWRGDIGRLCVNRDLSLTLDSEAPLLGSHLVDPISLSYPWVLQQGPRYTMWYGSTVTWDAGNGEMLHPLHRATSSDGHHWERHGCDLPHKLGEAQAFSRPSVVRHSAGYAMWFSYRGGAGNAYRIGQATSPDGVRWTLDLQTGGLAPGPDAWDADMVAYPCVFSHEGRLYMLYNGSGYGRTGFGLAVWSHGD